LGGSAEKVVTFLNNISQTKTSVGGLNKAFFHHLIVLNKNPNNTTTTKTSIKRRINKYVLNRYTNKKQQSR
jgi:hypothetical protein